MNTTLEVESEPIRNTTQALARRTDMSVTTPMSVQELVGQVQLIQEVMRSVMKEGEHYGKIPGCGDKPALLKAGAEKLGMTFRLAPSFDVRRTDHAGGHREYEVICTLNGKYQGVGTCATMEAKYRFRTGPKTPTEKPVPKAYWDMRQSDPAKAQQLLGGKGFSTMKVDGNWMICEQGEKVEHDNPADHYNTVLKMAKKRAHVDAVLTATAASDCFVQDLEEMVDSGAAEGTPAQTTAKPINVARKPPAAPKQATPDGKPFKSKAELIRLLEPCKAHAVLLLQEQGVLNPDQGLADWPESQLPQTPDQLNALLDAVKRRVDGEPDEEFTIQGSNEPWRDMATPFAVGDIPKGTRFGDLPKNKLWWWCQKWVPKPYNGKINPADTELRKALDTVDQKYFSQPAKPPQENVLPLDPNDDVPF